MFPYCRRLLPLYQFSVPGVGSGDFQHDPGNVCSDLCISQRGIFEGKHANNVTVSKVTVKQLSVCDIMTTMSVNKACHT